MFESGKNNVPCYDHRNETLLIRRNPRLLNCPDKLFGLHFPRITKFVHMNV